MKLAVQYIATNDISILNQRNLAVQNFQVYNVFAHETCNPGIPYDSVNSVCLDNCGIVPDPYRYDNVPELDMKRVELTRGIMIYYNFIIMIYYFVSKIL